MKITQKILFVIVLLVDILAAMNNVLSFQNRSLKRIYPKNNSVPNIEANLNSTTNAQHHLIATRDYSVPGNSADPLDPANKRKTIVYLKRGHVVSSNIKAKKYPNSHQVSNITQYSVDHQMGVLHLVPDLSRNRTSDKLHENNEAVNGTTEESEISTENDNPQILNELPTEESYIEESPIVESLNELGEEPSQEIEDILDAPPMIIEEPEELDFQSPYARPDSLEIFYRISKNAQKRETKFQECLNTIKDDEYNQNSLDRCIGRNFSKLHNAVDFLKKQAISAINYRIEKEITAYCYEKAGLNLLLSHGCDILINDVIDLLWSEYNFFDLPYSNWQKYTKEYSVLPNDIFSELLNRLKTQQSVFLKLLKEVYDHQALMVSNIKGGISVRRSSIFANEEGNEKDEPQETVDVNQFSSGDEVLQRRLDNRNYVNLSNHDKNGIVYDRSFNPTIKKYNQFG